MIAQLNGSGGVDVQLSFFRSSAVIVLRRASLAFLCSLFDGVLYWAANQPWD
jgi:hypothetical protein